MTRIAIRLGLVFAGFVVIFTVLSATGSRSLQREVAVWRSADLIRDEQAPAEHETGEAYARWTQAAAAMAAQQSTVRELLEADDPASAAEADERLRAVGPLLAVVHAAAGEAGPVTQAGPGAPYRWSEQLRDRLHESRDFVRLLAAEARWQAIRGDRAAAAGAIAAGLDLAERAGEHGVWVGQLVRLSLLERMLLAVEFVYAEEGLPPASLRDRLGRIDLRSELAETFAAEGVHTLRLVSDTDPSTSRVNWSTRGWWYHDTAYLLERYRTCIDLLGDEAVPLAELPLGADESHPFWARTARVVLPGVHASLGARLALQMRLAMAETAMQLREQAMATGAYPASLAAVDVPTVEPGLAEPMVYERDEAGFVLRSSDELAGDPVRWRWR